MPIWVVTMGQFNSIARSRIRLRFFDFPAVLLLILEPVASEVSHQSRDLQAKTIDIIPQFPPCGSIQNGWIHLSFTA